MSHYPAIPPAALHRDSCYTLAEIVQQPLLWPTTVRRVQDTSKRLGLEKILAGSRVLITGAGSSAYAANSVAHAWPRSIAVPTTDLLVDPDHYLRDVDVVVSLARSGNSPESVAVVDMIRHIRPEILQLAITCNAEGALARSAMSGLIVLDPRTNDRSLVMTSSFPNMVLAGL
jgi:tagatose-6-phosphate ketose/aldose isomerase